MNCLPVVISAISRSGDEKVGQVDRGVSWDIAPIRLHSDTHYKEHMALTSIQFAASIDKAKAIAFL
jgi:hypothetical protein